MELHSSPGVNVSRDAVVEDGALPPRGVEEGVGGGRVDDQAVAHVALVIRAHWEPWGRHPPPIHEELEPVLARRQRQGHVPVGVAVGPAEGWQGAVEAGMHVLEGDPSHAEGPGSLTGGGAGALATR